MSSQLIANHPDKTDAKLAKHFATVTQSPRSHVWTRKELAELFGDQKLEAVVAAAPVLAMYVAEGIDFSTEIVRARLGEGGDFREVLGVEVSDALLALGVETSTNWAIEGGQGESPTAETVKEIRATTLNQEANMERARNQWNTRHEFIFANPAATWAEVVANGGE